MENNEVEKIVIDDVEYEVNSLSDRAKMCVAQLKDLQNQINISNDLIKKFDRMLLQEISEKRYQRRKISRARNLSRFKPSTTGLVANENIASSAAIAKTKLAALDIVNADINASAGIAFSKLTGVTNGVTEADEFRWNDSTNNANGVTGTLTTWERNDTDFEKIGTGMTVSSGIFSFPSTGKYLINYHLYVYSNSFTRVNDLYAQVTTDNSSYNTRAYHSFPIPWASSYMHTGGSTSFTFDVTNTTNCKVKFLVNFESPSNVWIQGSTTGNNSYVQFLKLGET